MHMMSQYTEITQVTPTEWQKDDRVAALVFSLKTHLIKKHLKWDGALQQLTAQIVSKGN